MPELNPYQWASEDDNRSVVVEKLRTDGVDVRVSVGRTYLGYRLTAEEKQDLIAFLTKN